MIQSIVIENFKCFHKLELSLSKLNVFTGINGMGKSSLIQTILLIRQTIEQGNLSQSIILNGKYISLGKCRDILTENANSEEIRLEFEEDGRKIAIVTKYDAESDLMGVMKLSDADLPWLKNEFEYISADRLSPKSVYEQSSLFVDVYNQLGTNGQYTAHFLAKHQDDIYDQQVGDKASLRDVVQFWLEEISPNIKFSIQDIKNTNLSQLNYYYMGKQKSNEYRPINVGFGITFVLPVITALVKAKPNSILILENPEAHLHPKGQRKMGELIAETASKGVQIFLETHSDHIINGIRLAVKNKKVNSNDVRVCYFTADDTEHIVETPRILDNGKLDYWPEGFFDEWDNALNELIQ